MGVFSVNLGKPCGPSHFPRDCWTVSGARIAGLPMRIAQEELGFLSVRPRQVGGFGPRLMDSVDQNSSNLDSIHKLYPD